ncbi:hypothetical protein [Domibacillus indicus]|uniref:hypothetical protein n=1 Tax=Domibacillus indicus TaxID=1437523 RepID=UPI0037BE7FA1
MFISHQGGTPTGPVTVLYSFERLHQQTGVKRITPHGLRHTHAPILIARKCR